MKLRSHVIADVSEELSASLCSGFFMLFVVNLIIVTKLLHPQQLCSIESYYLDDCEG